MDRKQQMIDQAKKYGREGLYLATVALIEVAVDNYNLSDAEKIADIKQILAAAGEVRNDQSLPYTEKDARRAREEEAHAEN